MKTKNKKAGTAQKTEKHVPHVVQEPEKRNPNNQDSFAYRLIYALKLRKLLAIDICQQTEIGKSTMSLYVNGKSMPSKERLVKISEALRVDPAWLLGLAPLQAYNRYEDNDPYLDEELEKLKNIYNSLNKEGKKFLTDTATLLFESKHYIRN